MKTSLQAYLKNSIEAVPFYEQAFGATLGYHVFNEDGTFMHAELNLDGQNLLSISESGSNVGKETLNHCSPADYPTMNFCVLLEDEEAVKKAYEILVEGGNILLPLGELPWSKCCANVIDRFGIFWYIYI